MRGDTGQPAFYMWAVFYLGFHPLSTNQSRLTVNNVAISRVNATFLLENAYSILMTYLKYMKIKVAKLVLVLKIDTLIGKKDMYAHRSDMTIGVIHIKRWSKKLSPKVRNIKKSQSPGSFIYF